MTAPAPDQRGIDERRRRNELFVVLVMGITALLTAWSGYQSTKWSGAQSAATSSANAARTESIRASTEAQHQRQVDISTFVAWIDAVAGADDERADFIAARFTDRLAPAFRVWVSTDPRNNDDAPATPFELDEYVVAADAHADELRRAADAHATAAATASGRVDHYVVMSVLFAIVLLFTGISTKLRDPRNQLIVLDVAIVGLVAGALILVFSPINL